MDKEGLYYLLPDELLYWLLKDSGGMDSHQVIKFQTDDHTKGSG